MVLEASLPRPASPAERAVIRAMAERARSTDGAAVTDGLRRQWSLQADGCTVTGHCDCGTCPSVELGDAAGNPVPDGTGPRVVLSAGARNPTRGVLLFIDGDRLSYLEVYPIDDDPVELPEPEELEF
ncbi:hypothetical protein NQ036_07795 [Brevibacterium sp. 91QC2O2]|jgi:hypothetical protein|uniref:hypothetical protein n=1 Tax=Brevibacterium sp. 91QC2O2 TaxID=2968458 RepID=UPI00211BC5C6|nr:hypothetical protein [Brevibacterium sp. 91QC2O2]MCQ9368143.1 hypothetical protein [Brevibacterium sp. 91QC2O2]